MPIRPSLRLTIAVLVATFVLSACGSNGSDNAPTLGTGGAALGTGGAGSGGAGGTTAPARITANGQFEIHYLSDVGAAVISGRMYDGPLAEAVIWDKKKTEGSCSLLTPRTPFCEACAATEVCVDTNVCRTPPSNPSVGAITLSGLASASGANPLPLTDARTTNGGTVYNSVESPPLPPCTEGSTVRLDATGMGDYPAFSVQAQCIAPLVVTTASFAIEGGKDFALTWTPSTVAASRIRVEFDLTHHGGSKGRLVCDTADTGAVQVPGSLMQSLVALGATGFPRVIVTRSLTGTTPVGAGQAELDLYSDLTFQLTVPGLHSCEGDADCPAGKTCALGTMTCTP